MVGNNKGSSDGLIEGSLLGNDDGSSEVLIEGSSAKGSFVEEMKQSHAKEIKKIKIEHEEAIEQYSSQSVTAVEDAAAQHAEELATLKEQLAQASRLIADSCNRLLLR